MINDMIN